MRTSPAPGAPLGPRSRLHRVATDWRCMLSGPSAGILQLMWPHLGQGVTDHSAFFSEPFDRIYRSIPQIWATILAEDAEDRGSAIRDLHRDIKGTDPAGDRYHALDPDTFWWAHATFTWEMFQTIDRWDHGSLRGRRREQLYQETVTWYRRYGVSDRPVPADHRAFEARFEEICRNELAMTPAAARAIEIALRQPLPSAGPVAPIMRLITIGSIPTVVRRRFGIPFTRAEHLQFAAVTSGIRTAGAALPHWLTRGPFLARVRQMKHLAKPHPDAGTSHDAGSPATAVAGSAEH